DLRQLGLDHVLAVVRGVVVRTCPVELVLVARRDHYLVDQRVAQARDLDVAAFDVLFLSKSAFVTSSLRRSVVDQTPTTALPALAEETLLWSFVTFDSGTWRTTECVAIPDRSSRPPPLLPVRSRMFAASKTAPRSTKNGSSRWPANTLPPP